MTREKEIENAMKASVAETIYASGWGITPQATDLLECAFTKGAKWADENPDKRKVYTKEELFKMGFAFDTNGNIADPKRDAEMWDRYVEYKQAKWIDKVCKYITPILKTYCSDECVKELIEGLRNKMVSDL